MNNDKEVLIQSWKWRSYLYFLGNGFRQIIKSKKAIIFSAIYWTIYLIFPIFIKSFSNTLYTISNEFWFNVFAFGIYFAYTLFLGMPKGARKAMRDFTRIGLVNHAYETPLLMEKYYEHNHYVYKYRNFGIPLSKWNDLKGTIEAGLNYNIISIDEHGKKWIVIKAVSGDIVFPQYIEWNEKYLTPKNEFKIALGEGYQGTVTADLSKMPHMLIGGSTGSGKSVLLRNIIYQCLCKNSYVVIIDFKGGVDYSQKFKDRCKFITDEDRLIKELDEIVETLHIRKKRFAEINCPNIDKYPMKSLKRVVVCIDEVAEILDKTGLNKEQKQNISEIESKLSTIARLGRAFGIHLILATQRPDANILNGQIKNNIDVRVCGRADDVLSQIILDKTDASDLIPKDAQGRFLTNDDVLFQGYWFDDSMFNRR